MISKKYNGISIFLIALIVSMPLCFATELKLTYDPNGNLVTGDGFYRTYNSLNQLWKVYDGNDTNKLLEEYTYHPIEERVWMKKTYNESGSLAETVYYINENTVKVVNASGTFNFTYVYHEGQLVAESLDGVKTFVHPDHKGSVAVTTNSSGGIVEKTFYDPFGAVISGGTSTRYGYEAKEHTIRSTDAVGYWGLDDNNLTIGGYTFYNGVAVGASQNTFGKYGNSYYFDGNNDYVNISKNALSSSSFTIMFWSYTPSANNNTGYIFCDANSVSNLFFRRYDNGLKWNGQIDGVNMGSTTTNIPRDEWVHTAVVLNGSTAYVYVNGVKMNMTGTTTGITFTGLTTSLFLGNRQVLDRDYEGYLDNFMIYSRAMSQSEIQSVYDNEHPLSGQNLVSSFEFENGVNDSNNLIAGQYDGAYRFEHQYVDITDYNALDLDSDITISAWVYPTSGAQGYVVSKWRAYILQFRGTAYSNTMQGAIYTSGAFTPLATSTEIPLNSWSHVVFTYNKTISKIYINGELSGTQSSTSSIDTTNNNLTIGGRNSTDRTRDFNGTIDEVYIFSKALTADEVQELYSTNEISSKGYADFHARMYWPPTFNQPDSLIVDPYAPQNLNRYAFEGNSPYGRKDPNGHWVESALDVAFISYDVYTLSSFEGRSDWVNWVALATDVTFAILPFATGGGALVRGVTKTEALSGAVMKAERGTLREALIAGKEASEIAGKQAHHVFPVQFADKFADVGININRYGALVDSSSHLKNAYNVNKQWETYFKAAGTLDFSSIIKNANKIESSWRGSRSSYSTIYRAARSSTIVYDIISDGSSGFSSGFDSVYCATHSSIYC